jgi:cholesterol oxidase
MEHDFDFIVIGSGFGGSVMSSRLTEKGHKVCLLERGKRYKFNEFPRRAKELKEKLFWDPKDHQYGFMEIRDYEDDDLMSVSASGLGGGSLIYANVLMKMPEENFAKWPGGINRPLLDPYYDKVLHMMEAEAYPHLSNPYYQDTPKTQHFKDYAEVIKSETDYLEAPKLIFPHLAIRFSGSFPGEQTKNIHGALQSSCIKCGECDVGCNIHAKNSLDLNYLYRAEHCSSFPTSLEIRTEALVTTIIPLDFGFQVVYLDLTNPKSPKEVILKTAQLILSAGTVGSNELLLKMKKHGHLPKLSKMLGKKWCGNGDLEGMVLNTDKNLDPTNGPVITSALQFKTQSYPDGFTHNMYLQDAGLPNWLAWYLSGKVPQKKGLWSQIYLGLHYLKTWIFKILKMKNHQQEVNIGEIFSNSIDGGQFLQETLILLGMGRDRSNGEVSLNDQDEAVIKWTIDESQFHYDLVRREMKKIAEYSGGTFVDNPLTHFKKIIAVHPLGGCVMADSIEDGVVNTKGEVFNYPGLYVVDGSIIPTSIGPNPSLTIAAMAEYIADQIPFKSS